MGFGVAFWVPCTVAQVKLNRCKILGLPVRTLKVVTVVLVAAAVLAPQMGAQSPPVSGRSLPISLFERYLESLRQQAGIPGLSAAIVQDGRIVWDNGFGYQDVEALIRTTAITPYPIEDLSQALASTLLLQRCLDSGRLELDDRVRRWSSGFPEDRTTVGQLLRHTSPSGGFEYDTARYASLSTVVEQCASQRYPRAITDEILDFLRMEDSVPSHDYTQYRSILTDSLLARYSRTLQRLAVPYRVDGNRRPVRSEYTPRRVNGSTGVVSTARDLARFDMALADGLLALRETLDLAWSSSGSLPTGLGWFVQRHNGERIVWHFGLARDAYSALYIKVPGRNLTLILLANSDGLAAPYNLSDGNLTVSVFAQLFLQLFVS